MIEAGLVAGRDTPVPVLGGATRRHVNLDHAASTPPFARVQRAVHALGTWYANVHRGTGFKSRLSSHHYDLARREVLAFVGAPEPHVAIFTRNTTESLNHAAQAIPVPRGHVVVTTGMEHHSNDLPWRRVAPVVHVPVDAHGGVDESALQASLAAHAGRVAVLAVSGASNVTGVVNPVRRWARWAHAAGALVVMDGAQLIPHRPFAMGAPDDPERVDVLAFSAHKMYAPFGTGVLVAPRALFTAPPRLVGGGTVATVDLDDAAFLDAPEREEAGTPCISGAVALAASIAEYRRIGWDAIAAHERALLRAAWDGLRAIPGVTLYGPADADRLAVIAFNVRHLPHALVAAILSEEWGIGTRSGCFCAHPYAKALLGIGAGEARALARRLAAGDHGDVPGMVRASFGLSNTLDDAELLVEAVAAVAAGRHRDGYVLDAASGEYHHPDLAEDYACFVP